MGKMGIIKVKQKSINNKPEETFTIIVDKNFIMRETVNDLQRKI